MGIKVIIFSYFPENMCCGYSLAPLMGTHNICMSSRKHAYIILTPLKIHFYIVKLGFTGFYIICLILLKKPTKKLASQA